MARTIFSVGFTDVPSPEYRGRHRSSELHEVTAQRDNVVAFAVANTLRAKPFDADLPAPIPAPIIEPSPTLPPAVVAPMIMATQPEVPYAFSSPANESNETQVSEAQQRVENVWNAEADRNWIDEIAA